MNNDKIIRDDSSEKIIKKILFERPISRLQARRIGLLAGRHSQLKKISDIHNIVLVMNHDISIVAEIDLKTAGVPAEVFLQPGKKPGQDFVNSDEAILNLQDCSYVVIGKDIEISSRLQLFLEKLIASRNAPIIFTSESIGLFKITPSLAEDRSGDIYVCNTKKIIELLGYLSIPFEFKPNAGLLNKVEILKILAEKLQAHIICVEDYQILSSSYTDLAKAVAVNLKNLNNTPIDYLFIPILASLLCDTSNPDNDMVERILTAGYLTRKSLEQGEFIVNLKKLIQNS